MGKRITKRTAERLARAAYEFEALAATLRGEGYDSIGNGVKEVSRQLGAMGRTLYDELEAKKS